MASDLKQNYELCFRSAVNWRRIEMEIQVIGMPIEAVHTFASAQEMIDAAPALGWAFAGFESQSHLAKQLVGLPKFTELCGPMGSGDVNKIRYETWPAHELYST